MDDTELLEQVKMGRQWINRKRKNRWSLGLMRYYLKQSSPWPVDVNYLDTILARLETLLEKEKKYRGPAFGYRWEQSKLDRG
jgi:hypothetical protein